jgi:fibronectin-binding autotransporter adhesin
MKTKFRSAKLAISITVLLSAFAITSAFGQLGPFVQSNFWIGIPGTVDGTNFGVSTNWSNGITNFNSPFGSTFCQFAGAVGGVVNVVSYDGIDHDNGAPPGVIGGSFNSSGVSIELTSNQTNPVNFFCPISVLQPVGMGFNGFRVDAGAGQFTIGNNTASPLALTLRPSAGTHVWENDSTNPVVLMPSMQIANGGGNQHEIDFMGTGDFAVTNNLRSFNNPPVNNIQFFNTGTTTWVAGGPNNVFHDAGLANVTINPGSTLIIKTNGLLPIVGTNTLTHNGKLLKFDATSTAQDTFNFPINGSSPFQWNGGTWTLTSGASTYTGSNLLTGGELIVSGTENGGVSGPLGVGNTISFQGGTLGFGANNFDYSPRFDTANGQAYKIDTGVQSVTFATGLGGTGNTLTKLGAGTLTLSGNSTYTGLTTVSAGRLEFQGTKSGNADIIVSDSAALGVTDNGTALAPNTLTVGSSSGATLEFNNIHNPGSAPLTPNNLVVNGPITINVNSGTLAVGLNYPLLCWSSGTTPAVNLGSVSGALGNLFTNGNCIELNIAALADFWNGTNGPNWSAANNWLNGGAPTNYANPVPVVFDDTAAGTLGVTVDVLVQPKSVVFNNNINAYTITSSGGNNIGGNASITKNGTNTVTLIGGANTYANVTTINAGTLSVSALANGGLASDIGASSKSASNLVLSGTLQFTGAATTIDRLFTASGSGGAIDASGTGALNLNNNALVGLGGPAPRVLTLTGTSTDTNTLAAGLGDLGVSTALTKSGPGRWVLLGNNTYSGVTLINNGTLQIGNGGASGSLGSGNVTINGNLDINRSGSVTMNNTITGSGSLAKDGTGTLILPNNYIYSGGTTINAGTLQVGNGGVTGSLNPNGAITNNGLLIFNTSGNYSYAGTGLIGGSGNLRITSGARIKAVGANTYTGWTQIDAGANFQPCEGNQGQLLSSVVTNFGTLEFVRQDQGVFGYSNNIVGSGSVVKDVNNGNPDDVTLVGINTYTGGTFIAGGGIILGDGVTPGAGQIAGNVTFTFSATGFDVFRYLKFNRPDSFTFSGAITWFAGGNGVTSGQVIQNGAGTLTLSGNNTYLGGTAISNGVLVVSGSIGTGPVIDMTSLIFSNASTTLTVPGAFSGPGTVVMGGSGLTTLSANNNTGFTGTMTASNGILAVVSSAGAGTVNVSGGTLAAGGYKSISTLTIGNPNVSPAAAGSLNINSGTVSMSLNKALAQSNSFVQMTVTNTQITFITNIDNSITTNFNVTTATGAITYTSGTLQLINVGPTPTVGDKFVLFSEPITGGAGIPISSPGFTVMNNLAVDGSVTIAAVTQPPPPKINNVSLLNGTNLVIQGTNNFGPGGSWDLLATNILGGPLANWPVINSGTFDANGNLILTNPIGTNAQQFFDLRVP